MLEFIEFIKPADSLGLPVYFLVAIVLIFSYLLGSVPNGFIISKRLCNIDITKTGSGNIGATNIYRTLGPLPALLVFVLDFIEGFLPVLISKLLLKSVGLAALAGVFSVIGHNYSIFMPRFKGGKGVATSFGAILGLSPSVALISLSLFSLAFVFTKYVSLGSLIGSLSVPVSSLILHGDYKLSVLFGFFTVLIFISHRDNITRLARGQERKTEILRKK